MEVAKKWSDVQASPDYQALPPEEQGRARDQYWNDVIAPKVPEAQRAKARTQFDADTVAPSTGEYVPPAEEIVPGKDFSLVRRDEILDPFKKVQNQVQSTVEKAEKVKREFPGKQFQDIVTNLRGRFGGADYSSGADAQTIYNFRRADSDEERKKYLSDKFGDTNVTQDRSGNWMFRESPEGLWKEVYGSGGKAKNIGTAVAAEGPGVAGMIAGGALAEAVAPEIAGVYALTKGTSIGDKIATLGGKVGRGLFRSSGAGVGAAAGGLADEGVQALQGFSTKSKEQVAKSALNDYLFGTGGDALFRLLKVTGGTVGRGYSPVVEDETRRLNDLAFDYGMTPKVAQAFPASKLFPFEQTLATRIWGFPKDEANKVAIEKATGDFLKKTGLQGQELESAMTAIRASDIPTEQLGIRLTDVAQKAGQAVEADVAKATNQAQSRLDSLYAQIDKRLGSVKPGESAEAISGDIRNARELFSENAGELYGKIDQLVGNQKIVPSSPIRNAAKKIMKAIPTNEEGQPIFTDELGQVFRMVDRLKTAPEYLSFREAQQYRSQLGQLALANNLTPGVDSRMFDTLEQAVDRSIKQAAGSVKGSTAAVRALDKADEFYATNIQQFKDRMVNQLVKEAGRGGLEPEKVVALITNGGKASQASRIKDIVTPETWGKVAAEDWRSLLDRATDISTGVEKVSGTKLERLVRQRGQMLDTVYGAKPAQQIREYAKALAALDGKLDASELTAGGLRTAVEKAQAKQVEMAAFYDRNMNLMADLAKPGFEASNALDYVLRPGNTSRIKTAKDFFGEKSPEWTEIQQKAMTKILGAAVEKADEGPLAVLYSGNKMYETLTHYKRETLDALFGPKVTKDLFDFADVIRHVTAKGKNQGAAMFAAGSILAAPLSHVGALVDLAIGGKLLASEGFLRWLSAGIQGDPIATRIVTNLTRAAVYEATGAARENRADIPPNSETQKTTH